MPKISIITPAFIDTQDKLTWLREMLLSLKSQRFTDWEVIIIDDASPLSLDALKAEFNEPVRYRFFRTSENSGPGSCRNTAVALAESEALLPVDADDVLADENTLAAFYGAWEGDHNRVVYGDIQRLENGQRGRVFNLPEYTFQRSLDFNGIMPVTALHSKEAHIKAGGWKLDLSAGLEDVEYWIAAGKAGFCGHRIGATTLLYRRHETSRSFNLRMINRQETEMRNKILDLHRDVYEGRLPMGCCGGGGSSYIPPQNMSGGNGGGMQSQSISTPLTDFPEGQKQWTQYLGTREGSWGVVGEFTGIHYVIDGPGHKFEVHLNDLPKFRRSGRGRDFAVGVPGPIELTPVVIEIPAPVGNGRYQGPEPKLAQIERLDEVAAKARGVEAKPAPVANGQSTYDLSGLDLGEKIQRMLEDESWTVEKLAQADPEELRAYPGVGPKIASQITQKAKEYIA